MKLSRFALGVFLLLLGIGIAVYSVKTFDRNGLIWLGVVLFVLGGFACWDSLPKAKPEPKPTNGR